MKSRTMLSSVVFVVIGTASAVNADVVTDWNSVALSAIRANKTPPPRASRALAVFHVAIYDAVNGIVRTHEPYRVRSSVPPGASIAAAASAAAHAVLVTLFASDAASLDETYMSITSAIADGPYKRRGIQWGEFVARDILAWRVNDNADAPMGAPFMTGAGAWEPTPPAFAAYLLPQWGAVTPFAIPTGSFMRPPGPPSLDSPEWAADYNEVKALGAAEGSSRTAEQDLIALFWADGSGTETPPGHWNTIAQRVSSQRRTTLQDKARLFALLNMAMADAAICAWDAKYAYDFWRPVTAIRNGDADGNPDTPADPSWSSFIVTPPFPDYISGHSTFSAAAATVLAMFYDTDRVRFTAESDALPGVTRHFTSFTGAAAEAALSRVYGGIHFRAASKDGLTAGAEIGEWTVTHYLQPKGNRSKK